jgi:hypothetical protein
MRKYIDIIAIMCTLIVILVVGCGKIRTNPKDILLKYLDASLHGRYEEAYHYFSTKDKAVKSLQEYLSEQAKEESPLEQALASKISYRIREVTVAGNQAKANAEVTTPDLEAILKDILGTAFISAFGEKKEEKETEKMLEEKYKGNNIPMKTTIQSFDMVKEADGWKVFFDFEKKEKVDKAMNQAQKLEKEKKLYAAKEKYQEVLKLDSKAVEASEKIEHLDVEIENFKEKQTYIGKIKITKLKVAKSFLGGLGVFGELKNLGNRSLKEVEITIYFLDKNGKPIFEEVHYPVLVSEYSFGDINKPLKLNYTRKFGYSTNDVPSDWAKKVRAKITNIEFE